MIKELNIKNYAIIDHSRILFDDGLTIITGETGAGKSILIGALSLILGERADLKALLNKDNKCFVEGIFDIKDYKLASFFKENDLDYDDELIIRREITPQGKSRAFVNDSPVVLQTLRALSSRLIDLHRQFETLEIHDENFQMNILDVTASLKKKVAAYHSKYIEYKDQKARLAKLEKEKQQSIQRLDFVKFQVNELTELNLIENESVKIGEEQNILSNATEIKQLLGNASSSLENFDGGLIDQLRETSRSLSQVSNFDNKIESVETRLNALIEELADINNEISIINDKVEYDPQRLEEIEERLQTIFRITQKHGVQNSDQLLEIQATFEKEMFGFADTNKEIEKLSSDISINEKELRKTATELSSKRQAVVAKIEKSLKSQLEELAMPHASIKVALTQIEDLGPNGIDQVNFLFSANKGFELKPLKNVASGGELSRINLCLKSLVAGKEHLPSLVFDEIDTGISGDVAFKMGKMLSSLADDHQIICITHSPQVASRAKRHYVVEKDFIGDTTKTQIRLLEKEEQVIELAKMLSGNPPSTAAIANAKELIAT